MPPEPRATAPAPAMLAALPATWRAPLVTLGAAVLALVAATAPSWGEMLHQW